MSKLPKIIKLEERCKGIINKTDQLPALVKQAIISLWESISKIGINFMGIKTLNLGLINKIRGGSSASLV